MKVAFCNFYNKESSIIKVQDITHFLAQELELVKYTDLGKLIKYYDPPSIDFFLSSIQKGDINVNVLECNTTGENLVLAGKELIAYHLLKAEYKDTFNADNKVWYRWLRSEIVRIGKNKQEIKKGLSNVIIVSFNYDRSLESYLETTLPEYYELIKKNIIYPYGSLNSFDSIAYGRIKESYKKISSGNIIAIKEVSGLFLDQFLADRVNDEVRGILVIDDDREGEKKTKMHVPSLIQKSKKIYFFGFAFLKENLEFLGLDCSTLSVGDKDEIVNIYYTNYNSFQKVKFKCDEIVESINKRKDPHAKVKLYSSSKGVYDAIEQDFDLSFS